MRKTWTLFLYAPKKIIYTQLTQAKKSKYKKSTTK